MGSTSPSRRRALQGLGALALAPSNVWPAVGGLPSATHDASSPEWQLLSERLFPGRQLIAGQGTVQLIAPLRAAYGASVPVKVVSMLPQRPELYVRKVYLVVDKNPSPLAAVLDLSTEVGQADFETRLRVDEYSHVRVVVAGHVVRLILPRVDLTDKDALQNALDSEAK
jgi:sulfur-oxidizing protein SoxY